MQATDTPSIIHRYFMIKNSSFQTCNTLNIKALELYYNIKKWNIELDTLFNKLTSFYIITIPFISKGVYTLNANPAIAKTDVLLTTTEINGINTFIGS